MGAVEFSLPVLQRVRGMCGAACDSMLSFHDPAGRASSSVVGSATVLGTLCRSMQGTASEASAAEASVLQASNDGRRVVASLPENPTNGGDAGFSTALVESSFFVGEATSRALLVFPTLLPQVPAGGAPGEQVTVSGGTEAVDVEQERAGDALLAHPSLTLAAWGACG
jgi:hypothetical protein